MIAVDRRRDGGEPGRVCRLDGVIGDADHGIAMALGFAAARNAVAAMDASAEPTALLNAAAKAFLSAVGASCGPLYATALMRAACGGQGQGGSRRRGRRGAGAGDGEPASGIAARPSPGTRRCSTPGRPRRRRRPTRGAPAWGWRNASTRPRPPRGRAPRLPATWSRAKGRAERLGERAAWAHRPWCCLRRRRRRARCVVALSA